jgi:protein CpxP
MNPLSLKAVAALCAAGSVLSISAVALAQDARPAAAPGGPGVHGPGPRGPGGEGRRFNRPDPAQRAAHQAERSAKLRAILQITPAQDGAFQAWQAAMKPPARPPTRPDFKAMGAMTTPQRLDARLAMMNEHDAATKNRIEATKRFYSELTPSQRTAMDNLPPMMFGRGHGPGGRGGHGGPGGHGPMGHGRDGHRGPGGPDRGEGGFGRPQSFDGQ